MPNACWFFPWWLALKASEVDTQESTYQRASLAPDRAFRPGSKQGEKQQAPAHAAGSPTPPAHQQTGSSLLPICQKPAPAFNTLKTFFLQSSAFVTNKPWKSRESLSFPPVSPYSICPALIFSFLPPAEPEINNLCFLVSLVCHSYWLDNR